MRKRTLPQSPPKVEAPSRSRKPAPSEKTAQIRIERKLLSELQDHPRNHEIRKHPEEGTPKWEALKLSLENDYFDPMVWNERNRQLVSGHLRKKLLLSMGYTHADVSVVSYTEEVHLARLLAANKGMGDDDLEGQIAMLKELEDIDEDHGFALAGFTGEEFDDLLSEFSSGGAVLRKEEPGSRGGDSEEEGERPSLYTSKIDAPVYTPKGIKPQVSELYDGTRTDQLLKQLSEVRASREIPAEVISFLRYAAYRHTVFDYGKIAEFYAHAPAPLQRLMEDSTLIVVDIDKAIENGHVLMTKRFERLYQKNDKILEAEGYDINRHCRDDGESLTDEEAEEFVEDIEADEEFE
jgi:hypothetical protein